MAQKWEIEGPRVLDIGDENERVRSLTVGLIGGHVDVVTHDDSPTARVEVYEVSGRPLQVRWDGSALKILHVKGDGQNVWEAIKGFGRTVQRHKARISVSIPRDAEASVSTVSAGAVVGNLDADAKINTVNGEVTVDALDGDIVINTVSGVIEAHHLSGELRAGTVSGGITVHDSTLDPIDLNTVSGDITLDLTNDRVRITSNSVSGDVTIRMPLGDGYDLKVSTISGAAIVDGAQLGGNHIGQRGGSLHQGDGALRLKATSVSGDVVVLRSPDDARPTDRTAQEQA
ncbi:DUF4097 family beta strand repeat-containing protein [Luteipulveratus sp. YIM 133132]|uniref:DUF4097 family beta strand repeat-containing protein n=1 Tax=Luteipulveratus flavus TaxID=3031728 RepID=A0ABT6C8H8_9MICO|nr:MULTISPECIES: DUF4097 family beta strand repeat-containing protein [unclassified Luteipulveratus]MDE9365900.1 DUF4097 family beta strand repeat-containing protein [Luteipulveratus sp. YIM 133132]MDF8265090.1 DUF4097 family beta strand repeat-containing protein [Luteipulveratus sp. YIM 133296]